MGAKVTTCAGKEAIVTDEINTVKETAPTLQWNIGQEGPEGKIPPNSVSSCERRKARAQGVSCSWNVFNIKRLLLLWSEEAGLP